MKEIQENVILVGALGIILLACFLIWKFIEQLLVPGFGFLF